MLLGFRNLIWLELVVEFEIELGLLLLQVIFPFLLGGEGVDRDGFEGGLEHQIAFRLVPLKGKVLQEELSSDLILGLV